MFMMFFFISSCIVGLGFVLSALSVLVAGILEIYRKKDIEENGAITQTLSSDKFNASSISIFAQVPQFALVGASEVFASVSGRCDIICQTSRSKVYFVNSSCYVS